MTNTIIKASELSSSDCESLIEDLAQGLCSTFPLTPEQKLLSIPWALVYLAGLILSRYQERNGGENHNHHCDTPVPDVVPIVPESAHEQLRRYCQIYNRCLGRKGKPLQVVAMLSPRVCPSKEQQLVIQQDISNKAKAKVMLQELLLAADKEETTKENTIPQCQPLGVSKPKKKKKAKAKATQSTTDWLDPCTGGNNEVRPSSTKDGKPESLEEVIRIHLNTSHAKDDCPDTQDWIDVPSLTRTATRTNYSPVQLSLPKVETDNPKFMHQSQIPQDASTTTSPLESRNGLTENSYLAAARAGRTTEAPLTKSSDPPMAEIVVQQSHQGINNDPTTETDQTEPAVTCLESLRQRIMELEQALAESNGLLQKERQQHTTELKEERERHVNSMQALQLRLYISETRLKTYQDALEEHIHSVAENVYHPNASPPRRLCQGKDRKSPPPASPLMSRVLHKSNRLDESF